MITAGANCLLQRVSVFFFLVWFLVAACGVVSITMSAQAEELSTPPPPQVKAFSELLADPAVIRWLKAQGAAMPPQVAEQPVAPGLSSEVEARISAAQERFDTIIAGVSSLPADTRRVYNAIQRDVRAHGFGVVPLVVIFIALGMGAQWLVRHSTGRLLNRTDRQPSNRIADRLRLTGQMFLLRLLELGALGVTSIGTFIIFKWPPTVRFAVLGYLVAFLIVRSVALLSQTVLQPQAIPGRTPKPDALMGEREASFWYRRIVWLVAVGFFGLITIELFSRLGALPSTLTFMRAFLATSILVIALDAVWQRPGGDALTVSNQFVTRSFLLSGYLVLLWLLWLAGFKLMFTIVLALATLPVAIYLADRAIAHLFRPAGPNSDENAGYAALTIVVQRAMRAVILIGAAIYLHNVVRAEFAEQTESRTILWALGVIYNAVIAYALFDFSWRLIRAFLDKKIADLRQNSIPIDELAIRRHRLGTVLPILRNFLFVLVAVIAILTYLSSIGVAIGPLLAGASIFGVAIGFGAQTIVKDVLSGIFYLLDDAFRIGEYIQSGSYMGTVEGFTLRSIRLRHHNGPVFTVPFGSLGAVQNMSRDWALTKIVIGVTYGADISTIKKLIKQVGKELMENPEFAPSILDTLKMQGIDELGDFAVKIKLRMMTRPGDQGPIRRWALARIKTLFAENGVSFAYPTVKVTEGERSSAAALQSLAAPKPAKV